MKAVLISIQPKWCELIASGKKTVEVRKTRPKIETPFKCYIYATWNGNSRKILVKEGKAVFTADYRTMADRASSKVIGEFVCDEITEYEGEFYDDETQETIKKVIHTTDWDGYPELDYNFFAENGEENSLCKSSCVSWKELRNYMGAGINTFYGWHISDLVIYDKPRSIGEFCKPCDPDPQCDCRYCITHGRSPSMTIQRPPQSWCYVEKLKGGE